eukprot:1169584-Amphidinium_carterae.1
MTAIRVDGNDLAAVYRATQLARERCVSRPRVLTAPSAMQNTHTHTRFSAHARTETHHCGQDRVNLWGHAVSSLSQSVFTSTAAKCETSVPLVAIKDKPNDPIFARHTKNKYVVARNSSNLLGNDFPTPCHRN